MTSSSRSLSRRVLCAVPFALTLLASAPALAQRSAQDIASARQLYGEGIELREKGDLKGALEKFKAAHALGNTPLTGLELCKTHQKLNQPVEAREACLSVGRIGPIPEESQRSKDARVEAVKIAEAEKPKASSIKVKVTGVPAGFTPTVAIDGVAIPAAALNEPRPVDPGPHTVTAKVGTGQETKSTLETKEGEAKELELAVQPPAPEDKPGPGPGPGPDPGTKPPPPKSSSNASKIAFAVGGIGATLGLLGGLIAMTKEGELEKNCTNKICGLDSHDTLDTANRWGTISTVSFIVAGIGLGAGVVLYLTQGASASKSGSPTTKPSTFGFTLRGLGGTF